MDIGRLHRVLRIIMMLQSGRPSNAGQLATECGVSRRTVYRDLNLVEKAGIPFYFNSETGGYQIHETGLLPAINLNLEEALSLVLMATELGRTGRLPLLQPARDAAAKIESNLPLGLRAALGGMLRHMAVRPGPVARHNALQSLYHMARKAVVKHEVLDAVYISFHDQGQIRTRIEPYWLMFNERAWYLIGRSSKHRGIRTFKLGRFKALQPTGVICRMPRGLTLEKHLGNAWRMMRGEQAYRVHLKFSPLIGPNVAEVIWHQTQEVKWDDDGSVHFFATVDGLSEIVWWVLGYGPEVEVVEPPELRARLAQMAQRMIEKYRKT